MNEIGVAAERHEVGGQLNNRAENSHQPFRRRERAMQRFRSMKTLQKFGSVHAQIHTQFNQERHLVTRQVYKQRLCCNGRVARPCGVDRCSKSLMCEPRIALTTPARALTAAVCRERASESLTDMKEIENRKPWSQKSANGCNRFVANLVKGK
jgi:hypothetical protein